ncbi:MAG: ATP-binding protein [Candidatus Omnitrophota bacterium]
MIVTFFFYGLAFVLMGVAIFLMPKRNNILELSDTLWLVGLFGILHGLNEWVDMFILKGGPFDIHALKITGGLLLPASFLFLVIFGSRVIYRENPELKWLKYAWIAPLSAWSAVYFFTKGFLLSQIAARCFICIPGAFLSALAFHLVVSKQNFPKIIKINVRIIIFTLISYGILSGLVVPKADFLLASVINYENFSKIFILPVQFFRMLCAIILAPAFFLTTACFSYSEGRLKLRGGIRFKLTVFICMIVLLVMTVGTLLGYHWGIALIRFTIVEERKSLTHILSAAVSEMIDKEVPDIMAYTSDIESINSVKKANFKYNELSESEVISYLSAIDKQWVEAPDDAPLIKEYLNSEASRTLKDVIKDDREMAELFITDIHGGLAASSGRTSDFYQADEDWWKKAFNNGKGDVFIGDIDYDESSGALSFTIAVPIKDEGGGLIGIAKGVVDIKSFFSSLAEFSVGDTGHAILTNKHGRIIYHPLTEMIGEELLTPAGFQAIPANKENWIITKPAHTGKEKLIVWSEVKNPYLFKNGIGWRVFIEQEAEEAFYPVRILIILAAALVFLLIIITIPLVSIFSRIFIKPIKQLSWAVAKAAKLDFTSRADIKTGDEIEELAGSFNRMAEELKETTVSRDSLLKEVAEREKAEEKLREALKEEIKSREIMISMLDDNNQIREELERKLSDLKQAQEMLVQSEKIASLGSLVSDMAHEVNNPLMIISGNAQLSLMEDLKDCPTIKENLNIIKEECLHAKDIIQRLLMFSKPSKGELKEVDINESLAFVIKLLEHQFLLSDVNIIKDYTPSLPKIEIDEKQMHEVFMNMLKNSAEAMPKSGGSINVSTKQEGDYIRIDIKDTGCGILKEDMKKIFDPFFTTKESGTGLGLSVCYGIMKAHAGELKYESEPGKGARAIILLPIKGGQ